MPRRRTRRHVLRSGNTYAPVPFRPSGTRQRSPRPHRQRQGRASLKLGRPGGLEAVASHTHAPPRSACPAATFHRPLRRPAVTERHSARKLSQSPRCEARCSRVWKAPGRRRGRCSRETTAPGWRGYAVERHSSSRLLKIMESRQPSWSRAVWRRRPSCVIPILDSTREEPRFLGSQVAWIR